MADALQSTRADRGLTAIELLIAAFIFLLAAGALTVTFGASVGLWRQSTAGNEVFRQSDRTCNRIADLLNHAREDTIVEDLSPPAGGSTVTFKRNLGYTAGQNVWGPTTAITLEPDPGDPTDGADNNGNGLIDEGVVVLTENPGLPGERKTVLVSHVNRLLEGELLNGVDDNGNGLVDEKGLSFDRSGGVLNIRLTIMTRDEHGRASLHTVGTALNLGK